MYEDLPSEIRICPTYGPCYASDEEGNAFDVSDEFKHLPYIQEIREIEYGLYYLASLIDIGWPDDDAKFPWTVFDKHALEATRVLARLLRDTAIPVYYIFLNPEFRNMKARILT